jgi:hypothetical protein
LRPRRSSVASHTSPMPPAPMRAMIFKRAEPRARL